MFMAALIVGGSAGRGALHVWWFAYVRACVRACEIFCGKNRLGEESVASNYFIAFISARACVCV